MNTNELTGAALDWAVAKCEGHNVFIKHASVQVMYRPKGKRSWYIYTPSANWSRGGPIIEREMIELVPHSDSLWDAMYRNQHIPNDGPTPLIAAMRCYVASKLGDAVEVPEELCPPTA